MADSKSYEEERMDIHEYLATSSTMKEISVGIYRLQQLKARIEKDYEKVVKVETAQVDKDLATARKLLTDLADLYAIAPY